jgi:hypothetical protein
VTSGKPLVPEVPDITEFTVPSIHFVKILHGLHDG